VNNNWVSVFATALIINEVFANPVSGSEWVEIFYFGTDQLSAADYLNFTISDDKRVIYTFQGDEIWSDNFLVIEVSGLNNDQDSVILKDNSNNIIDQMDYSSTEKGLSWLRVNQEETLFVLGEPSPNLPNPIAYPSPTITPNPKLTPQPTPKPSATANPQLATNPDSTTNDTTTNKLGAGNSPQSNKASNSQTLSQQELAHQYFANYQQQKNFQIHYPKDRQLRQARLVFLGQKILTKAVVDVIIGGSLLIIAAVLLSYEAKKKS